MNSRLFVSGALLALSFALLFLVFPPAFRWADEASLSFHYTVRGESSPDSGITILYFSNDDIASLGGIPLQRGYFALLINVLNTLGARAIGVDVVFAQGDREHPEHDDLLASVIGSSRNVVLAGYFRSISSAQSPGSSAVPQRLLYGGQYHGRFQSGNHLEAPLASLLDNAAGFGHANLLNDFDIPVAVKVTDGLVPAFGMELLRIASGLTQQEVVINDASISMKGSEPIPIDARGNVSINFTHSAGGLKTVPAVDLMKAYDSLSSGLHPSFPLSSISGKIVLVGIIAEGRTTFHSTPLDRHFPSTGLHAEFLSNALSGNFLHTPSAFSRFLLVFLAALIAAFFMSRRNLAVGTALTFFTAIVLISISIYLFSASGLYLPSGPAIVTMSIVSLGLILIRQQLVHSRVRTLEEEKRIVARQLREKEESLLRLERQLEGVRENQVGVVERDRLHAEIEQYRREIDSLKVQAEDYQPYDARTAGEPDAFINFHGIVYAAGSPMGEVVNFIEKIADNDATVLILGESGTGKERIACAIHELSARHDKQFIAVNCGALSETLLESELFGHEKGAFTGAAKDRQGRFELADGGTIFLDEIAETSEAFQVKLLRVLQEGTFERVGGTETRRANVRVIAATNRDIKLQVKQKKFREDVFYRLNVFTVQLPPLRERTMDIPSLAEHFARQEGPEMTISEGVMDVLKSARWNGNVRELQSVMKRGAVLARAEGRTILRLKDLPEEIGAKAPVFDIEEYVLRSLREKSFARSAITETADELGGWNRGTVAEYFRGTCFRMFGENEWKIEAATLAIAGSEDPVVRLRAKKKLLEYLRNAVDSVDRNHLSGDPRTAARSKYKNLPQKYHHFLDEVIRSYAAGKWKLDEHN